MQGPVRTAAVAGERSTIDSLAQLSAQRPKKTPKKFTKKRVGVKAAKRAEVLDHVEDGELLEGGESYCLPPAGGARELPLTCLWPCPLPVQREAPPPSRESAVAPPSSRKRPSALM